MAIHTLTTVQKIPVSLKEAWVFFSRPQNLNIITPPDMAFRVLTNFDEDEIYQGQIIEYKVSPLFRIPLYWMSKIGEVKKEKFFVDEQRKGPYSLWHHEHHFTEIEDGVEMTDVVQYKIPLGPIGEIANAVFVKRELRRIFEFRYKKIEEIFGTWAGQTCYIRFK